MSDDSQVNFTTLRSVIDSYKKRKENLAKREEEVKERLAQLRAQAGRRDESIAINIETRESIVRSTSQVIAPNRSYSPRNENYVQGSGELLFHSKYCAYKDSDKSIDNASTETELANKCVVMPKKKSTGKSKFSYKNYERTKDLDSDSEEAEKVKVSPRKHHKKRAPSTDPYAEQRETREVVIRKHEKHSKRGRELLDRVPDSDRSISVGEMNVMPVSDGHRHKTAKPPFSKSTENRKMEYAAERLARIGLMRDPDEPLPTRHSVDKHNSSFSRYEVDETRDSTELVAKHPHSPRDSSNRDADHQLNRYPALKALMKDSSVNAPIGPSRKSKKSNTLTKKALSRKDSRDFEAKCDNAGSHRRPMKLQSSTSESGSISQCEGNTRAISNLRRVDSCRSSEEDRVKSRSVYKSSNQRQRSSSPTKGADRALVTNAYPGPSPGERVEEREYMAKPYSCEGHGVRPHSSPVSGAVVHGGGSHRGNEEKLRPHSPAERLDERSIVPYSYSRDERPHSRDTHDNRLHSLSVSSGKPDPRPQVQNKGYHVGTHGNTVPRSRSNSPAERLNVSGSYKESSRRPSHDQNQQLARRTSVDNDVDRFDEAYSNNFLMFLIRNSLSRAMSKILLDSDGCAKKPSQEILNSVQEIATIKKLICDELDRRESMGRPFKVRRSEKDHLMKCFVYVKRIHDRLERGFSVREALSVVQTDNSESAMRLHERTIRAIRQANRILGGNQPDPADADDLEKAAEECLRQLGELHTETISNYPHLKPLVKTPKTCYHKQSNQLAEKDICKSCRQDWFADEVTRLKDAILNIEQHLNSHPVKAVPAITNKQMKQQTSHQNDYDNGRDFSTTRSDFKQQRYSGTERTIKVNTYNMPDSVSSNLANKSYPYQKMGSNASHYLNTFNGSVYKTGVPHRQR